MGWKREKMRELLMEQATSQEGLKSQVLHFSPYHFQAFEQPCPLLSERPWRFIADCPVTKVIGSW
jgi:hypothetical protein